MHGYWLKPKRKNYSLRNKFREHLKYLKNEDKKIKKADIMTKTIEDACENAQNILKLKDILEEKMEEKKW